jgi:hypothetical protein
VALILLPDEQVWEQRILERLRRRSGLDLSSLSESDRGELRHVRNRYEAVGRGLPFVIYVDSGTMQNAEEAAETVIRRLCPGLAGHSDKAAASLE